MRSLLLFLSTITAFAMYADHLLGGEITYSYINDQKYEVNVTLYRDCDECKLAGQGGGTSTQNCSDLSQIFIRTISNTCSNKNIGAITLTKSGYENITEVCNTDNSRCGTNPTINYGIEAHHYKGTVDFRDFTSYNGCTFQLYIHKSDRTSGITTINSESDNIYTFALINPWVESVNSPKFEDNPKIIFHADQATYATTHANSNNDDSLVYKWAAPLTDYQTPVNYNTSFTASRWMTAYCPSGGNSCSPNPNVTPAIGLYLNPSTGDYVVIPTQSGEKTVRVIEVEQWRRHNGAYYLAGMVRQESAAIVISAPVNNAPTLTSNLTYTACVGQPFNATIPVSDAPTTPQSSQDSVFLTFEHEVSGLSATNNTPITAPYAEAALAFTPTANQIGTHYVKIIARDNQCPVFAQTIRTVVITVVPKPTVTFTVDEGFCGTSTITLTSNKDLTRNLYVKNENGEISNHLGISSPYTYQELHAGNYDFNLVYTDDQGCTDSISTIHTIKGNNDVQRARLVGNLTPCENSEESYYLTHRKPIHNVSWLYDRSLALTDSAKLQINGNKLIWTYDVIQEGITCPIDDSTVLSIVPSPQLFLADSLTSCFASILDLNQLNPSPSDGTWTYNSNPITNAFDISSITTNTDTTLPITYSYTDEASGCTADKTIAYSLLKSPEMQLQNQVVCGSEHIYYLNNSIIQPILFADRNITWTSTLHQEAISEESRPTYDIPTLGEGVYEIIAANSLPNGCETKDTATITVTKNLVIAINNKREICQSNDPININETLQTDVLGGFWDSDIIDLTDGIQAYTNKHCGPANFRYVYDRNNCYATKEVTLDFVCAPAFDFQLPDSICIDAAPITLSQDYDWANDDMPLSTHLDPAKHSTGQHSITASINTSTCTFDTAYTITLLEPVKLNLHADQSTLCEGDTLILGIKQSDYATTIITACNGSYPTNKIFKYVPMLCDLDRQKIELQATTSSTAHCPTYTATYELPYFAKPTIQLPPVITGCEPFSLTSAALPKDVIFEISNNIWNINGTNSELANVYLEEGTYQLNAIKESAEGCINHLELLDYLRINPKPEASFEMNNKDRLTLSKRDISLYNYSSISRGSFNSIWQLAKLGEIATFSTDNSPIYTLPADTGNFSIILTIQSDANCRDTVSHNVLVVPDIIAFIPSAFTPDNKGPKENSVFRVTSDHAQEYAIDIVNRWGQKVYSSENIAEVWDGTFNGQFCQNGVYVYAIKLINKAGKEYTYQGTVHLIR